MVGNILAPHDPITHTHAPFTHHLSQPPRISNHDFRQITRYITHEFDALLVCLCGERFQRFFEERGEVEGERFERQMTCENGWCMWVCAWVGMNMSRIDPVTHFNMQPSCMQTRACPYLIRLSIYPIYHSTVSTDPRRWSVPWRDIHAVPC